MESFRNMSRLRSDINILMVDGHALVRRGLKEFLREFLLEDGLIPHLVETASAHDAIEQVHAAAWDLVILDLNLPDMPWLEVLHILKSMRPTLAILIVSIYSEEHYATRALRAGALGYLTTETGPGELRAALMRLLQGESYVGPAPVGNEAEPDILMRQYSPGDVIGS